MRSCTKTLVLTALMIALAATAALAGGMRGKREQPPGTFGREVADDAHLA